MTIGLTGRLHVAVMDNEDSMLLRPFSVRGLKSDIITLAQDFVTDFDSIPRLVRFLIPSGGKKREPAAVHDWLYRKTGHGYTRKEADVLFLHHMMQSGVSKKRRLAVYYGVRVGGWVAWRRNRKVDK